MRRFIMPCALPAGDEITLDGDLYRHLVTVLRLQPGQEIRLADTSGESCTATIGTIGAGAVTLHLGPRNGTTIACPLRLILYQGMPKADKLELVIQKATELGVSRIVPFHAERSVVRIPGNRLPDRVVRWQRIALEAARQSGAIVPEIAFATDTGAALAECKADLRLLPWENEQSTHLRQILVASPPPAAVAIMIGPEGGFTCAEVATAATHGFQPLSLGPRILRTETAGIALLAVLQQAWGDIG